LLVKLIEGLEKRMKKLLLLVTLIAFASVPYIVEAKGHHKHHHKAKKKHHKPETNAVAPAQSEASSACDYFYPGKSFTYKVAGGAAGMLGLSIDAVVLGVSKENGLVSYKFTHPVSHEIETVENRCEEVKSWN
jgi:hypothetical protein